MLKSGFTSLALGATIGGATLAINITPVPVALAQLTPSSQGSAFDAGLADRRAYEEWFASLTGDFKKGVEYWAGQRSLTKPGSCYLPDGSSGGEFTQGCLAGQQRLAASDVRRKAEPDYRQGWNAYSPAATSAPVATATSPAAEPSPAYSEGLADRQAWEHYFNGLSGQTKEGAEYWTAHRSVQGSSCQPTTAEQQGEWQTGCLSAKRQLDPADERRLAEPDYRQGWNAYVEPESQSPVSAPVRPAEPTVGGSRWTMSPGGVYFDSRTGAMLSGSPTEPADKAAPAPSNPVIKDQERPTPATKAEQQTQMRRVGDVTPDSLTEGLRIVAGPRTMEDRLMADLLGSTTFLLKQDCEISKRAYEPRAWQCEYAELGSNIDIRTLVEAVISLDPHLKHCLWVGAARRQFNIIRDCNADPTDPLVATYTNAQVVSYVKRE